MDQMGDNRISRLEAIVEALAHDVQDLKDLYIAGNKTNWSVLAAWAAVVIAVVSLIGSGYVGDMTRVERDVNSNTKHLQSMMVVEAKQQVVLDIITESLKKGKNE